MDKSFSVLRVLAVASLLIGIIYLFNAFSGLTGYAVADGTNGTLRSFFGVVFVLIGVFSYMATRK